MRTIGILGGTFNPVHTGHLEMAQAAIEEMGCEEVWFMPAGVPPHKLHKPIASAEHRLSMLKLALAPFEHCRVFPYEIHKTTPCYTAKTMEELHKLYPEDRLYFIIGADSLLDLPYWKDPQKLFAQTDFLVFPRTGVDHKLTPVIQEYQTQFHASIQAAHTAVAPISSTAIRAAWRQGKEKTIASYLPPEVFLYIQSHKLYQENEESYHV